MHETSFSFPGSVFATFWNSSLSCYTAHQLAPPLSSAGFGAGLSLSPFDRVSHRPTTAADTPIREFLKAALCLPPYVVAVVSGLFAEARDALRLGRIDTCDVTSAHWRLMDANLHGRGFLAGIPLAHRCSWTAQNYREPLLPWSPTRHRLYHGRFRGAIRNVLLSGQRLRLAAGEPHAAQGGAGRLVQGGRAVLPPELWLKICSFARRRYWSPEFRSQFGGSMPVGLVVVVNGLTSPAGAALNGAIGTVCAPGSDMPSGRVPVQLRAGAKKSIRIANLLVDYYGMQSR